MVSQDEGRTDVDGFCVYDCIIITQLIDKLLRGGLVTGKEVGHVAAMRIKVVAAVERAISLNIDDGRLDQKEE